MRYETAHVSTRTLQDAYFASRLTLGQVARNLGWYKTRAKWKTPQADSSKVSRTLGMSKYRTGSGTWVLRQSVNYELALKLLEAMGQDPVEWGL